MKARYYLLYLLAVMLCIAGCSKAPVGDKGPTGTTGNKGPKGNKGDKGDQGNQGATGASGSSDVYYSNWMLVDSSAWNYDPVNDADYSTFNYYDKNGILKISKDTFIVFHADLPTPKITQGILDSGVVYYFIKDSAGPGVNNTWGTIRSFSLIGVSKISVTNRPNESPFDIYSTSYFTPGTTKLYLDWRSSGIWYDPSSNSFNPNAISYKEMPPKTKFYIRYVTIPGGKKVNGRTAGQQPPQFNNYASLKAYYHIPD